MANKKQKEKATEAQAPKLSVPTLTYEEYYQTLMLAKKIRLENEEVIANAKTPKEKIQLLESLFSAYQIPGTNPKEKEQAILLKVNIFMPDSEQFLIDYKAKYDKNIRLISEAYQIPAPFAISKVSEIGKYEKYLERLKQEGGLGELEVQDNTIPGVLASLSNSGALKPLYDPQTPPKEEQKKKKKKNHGKPAEAPTTVPTSVESVPQVPEQPASVESAPQVPEQPTPVESVPQVLEQPAPVTSGNPLAGVVSEELLRHVESTQRYCTRLLDQNEQLETEKDSLSRYVKELQSLIGRLKQENDSLRTQNGALNTQVSSLTEENTTLQEQLTQAQAAQTETTPTARTIAEETESEKKLRQQIKDIEFTNQELEAQLKEEKEKTYHYRNRAIVAEAQLDQLHDGMQGIFSQVDELDLSFMNEGAKKEKS